jgi:hypothetical protein
MAQELASSLCTLFCSTKDEKHDGMELNKDMKEVEEKTLYNCKL